jgi:hypothetical protein
MRVVYVIWRSRQTAAVDRRWKELARLLGDLGVWDGLPRETAAAQAKAVAKSQYPLNLDVFDAVTFLADGEDLAEGDVEQLLREMAPALQRHGVLLTVKALELPDSIADRYVIEINGRRCLVWEPDDWEGYRAWYYATVRPLAVVNDLLADAGATVRVFTLYTGGNEGIALLLDPQVPAAMIDSGLFNQRDLPSLASHDCRA